MKQGGPRFAAGAHLLERGGINPGTVTAVALEH
jgi:hypothetical protein